MLPAKAPGPAMIVPDGSTRSTASSNRLPAPVWPPKRRHVHGAVIALEASGAAHVRAAIEVRREVGMPVTPPLMVDSDRRAPPVARSVDRVGIRVRQQLARRVGDRVVVDVDRRAGEIRREVPRVGEDDAIADGVDQVVLDRDVVRLGHRDCRRSCRRCRCPGTWSGRSCRDPDIRTPRSTRSIRIRRSCCCSRGPPLPGRSPVMSKVPFTVLPVIVQVRDAGPDVPGTERRAVAAAGRCCS